MKRQLKLDFIPGEAILVMFIGASILPFSPLGFVLIAAGAIVMPFLPLILVRKEQ